MYEIDVTKCSGCEACVEICPTHAISIIDAKAHIDAAKCQDCGKCAQVCKQDAVSIKQDHEIEIFPASINSLPESATRPTLHYGGLLSGLFDSIKELRVPQNGLLKWLNVRNSGRSLSGRGKVMILQGGGQSARKSRCRRRGKRGRDLGF